MRDCAAILDAMAGAMPGDPYAAPPPARPFAAEVGAAPGRLRIGLDRYIPGGAVAIHPDCRRGPGAQTGKLLESLGHKRRGGLSAPRCRDARRSQHFMR